MPQVPDILRINNWLNQTNNNSTIFSFQSITFPFLVPVDGSTRMPPMKIKFWITEFFKPFSKMLPSSAVTICFHQHLRKASTPLYWCFYSTHGGQINVLQKISQTQWQWQNFVLILLILFPLLFLLPEDGSSKMLIIKTYYLITGLNVFFWMKWSSFRISLANYAGRF